MSCLMIMAGGTGGHVFPALAVAEHLRDKGVEVIWLGTRRGLEARVVPDKGFAIRWVNVEGVRGKGIIGNLLAPIKLLKAMWQSARHIRSIKPDCILGMGGFVSGPGGLVATLLRVPLVIHEQNAVAGLTNQTLAKWAAHVLTGFPDVPNLPKKAAWVGNPVRGDIVSEKNTVVSQNPTKIKLLVTGGSQGAYSFNRYLPQLFAEYQSQLEIWHQSGRGNTQDVEQRYAELGVEAKVSEFIEDMSAAYHWADLLVCRAGAMTVSECCAAGKPALFIPYPYSAGGHQDANAAYVVSAGAAQMVSNEQLVKGDIDSVFAELVAGKQPSSEQISQQRQKLEQMGQAAKELYKADAVVSVANRCEEYLHA